MKVAGIIAEYNPFHNGHLYQIKKTREVATHIVAVMSGSFVQRGEPALFDKWSRTRAALLNGVDLVVEMPVAFSLSAANRFAKAGVYILNQLGIDVLSFGSECGDIELLKKSSVALKAATNSDKMSELLLSGMSYPRAAYEVLSKDCSSELAQTVKDPNNILGIEYINAINEISPNIIPFTVKRTGAQHDTADISDEYTSASYLRELLGKDENILDFVPPTAFEAIKHGELMSQDRLEIAVLYCLRSMTVEEFSLLPDVCEGLENRLFSAAQQACSLSEFYSLVKTKRYTLARIRRITMSAFLKIKATDSDIPPQYIRVLGTNEKGMEILKAAKKTSTVIISPKAATLRDKLYKENKEGLLMLEKDFLATDLAFLSTGKIKKGGLDLTSPPIIK